MTEARESGNRAARMSSALIRMERSLESLSLHANDVPSEVWDAMQEAWKDVAEVGNEIITEAMADARQ